MGKEAPIDKPEHKEAQPDRLASQSPIPTFVLEKTKIVVCNQPILRILGCMDPKEVVNKSVKNFLSSQDFRKLQRFLNEEEDIPPSGFEVIAIKKDGSRFDALALLLKVSNGLEPRHQMALMDISIRQEQLRNLSRSEHVHRELVDHHPDGIAIITEEKISYVNTGFLALFGYEKADDLVGSDYSSIIDDLDREKFLHAFQKFEKRKLSSHSIHFRGKRKDHSTFIAAIHWIRSAGSGKPEIIAYHRDETELSQSKEELERKSVENGILNEVISSMDYSKELRQILHSGLLKLLELVHAESGGVFLFDPKNKTFELELKRNLADNLVEKLDHQTIEQGLGAYLTKTLEAQIFEVKKYPSYLPHGKLFKESQYSSVAFIPLVVKELCNGYILLCSKKAGKDKYPSKDFFGILGREIGSAVSNAKTYSRMKSSEEEFRRLVETASSILYEAAPNGAFRYVSPMIEKLVNYSPKDFYRTQTLWLSLIHPDDKKYLLERSANIDSTKEKFEYQYRVLPKGKASYRWVNDVGIVIRDEKGNVGGIHGDINDITIYKEESNESSQSNRLNSSILGSVREGVAVYNLSLKCIEWNTAMENITGLKKEEVLGKNVSEIFVQESERTLDALIEEALKGNVVTSEDFPYKISKTGNEIIMWGRYSPLRDSGGSIIGAVGVITDIGERKIFERERKESEQVLRNIIDTIGDILMITDLRGNVIQVNKAFLNLLGFNRTEVIGHEFPYPWLIEEEMGRYVLWIGTLREKNMLHDFDMSWKSKDGKFISMSLSTTLLRNSLGAPIAMVNIARDISERKRLSKDLENRNKQVELLNRIISAGNQSMDFEKIFAIIQHEISTIIPFDDLTISSLQQDGRSLKLYAGAGISADRQGITVAGTDSVEFDAIISKKPVIVEDLSGGKYRNQFDPQDGIQSKISIPIILKDRVLGTFSLGSFAPNSFTEHNIAILQSIVPQVGAIMDRAALFKQVSEDASYIHNLLDSIDSIVYTIDSDYRILEVNKAWYEFIQTSGFVPRKEYDGLSIFDVLPDESLKILLQTVGSDVLSGSVRFFSQEFSQNNPAGTRVYQLTINPMVIDAKITGLVISHSDITALKESELALKKSNEQLIALNEIASLQSSAHGLEEILAITVPFLNKMIGADAAVVYLVPRGGDKLELAHQVGFSGDALTALPDLVQKGSATGAVVGTKEPAYISTVASEHADLLSLNRALLKGEGIEALASIPLSTKDEVFGALDIFFRRSHVFSEQERQLLTLVGNQLGTAVENAHLYSELRSQIERLRVLYEFSEQLTSKLDIYQIYEVVYEHVARVIPFKVFTVTLVGSQQIGFVSTFTVRVQDGKFTVESVNNQSQKIDNGSPEWEVFETRRSFHDEKYSEIHVPMFSKESIIGVMAVRADQSVTYSDLHTRLLESIANLTAIALEKGKLYEEILQKSSEIERRNQELDDFTYVVSHDLKEPLISIEGFSKILQLDYRDILKGEGKEYLDSITGASVRMKGLIDDLLMLSRISRPSDSFKEVDVNSVILDIKNDMEFTIRQKNVDFVIPQKMPIVQGHETQVKIVFRNLIGNALKFNKSQQPRIEIGFQNSENNCYLFHVSDNGIGIDKEFFEKIFVIFQRLHRREDYEGTGAGLAIVKKIIEMHNGKIWVESTPGKGSTFYFTLPQYEMNQ